MECRYPYLYEDFLVLASHALVPGHLLAQLVRVIVFPLLLRHDRGRPDRREVIVRPVVAPSGMLQQQSVTIETPVNYICQVIVRCYCVIKYERAPRIHLTNQNLPCTSFCITIPNSSTCC